MFLKKPVMPLRNVLTLRSSSFELPPHVPIIANSLGIAHSAKSQSNAAENGPEVVLHLPGKIPAYLLSGGKKGADQTDKREHSP